jgi:hypothetical protein
MASVALTAAACSSSRPVGGGRSTVDAAPVPATTPYLMMTGGKTGWVVLRSGTAWILLRTTDGFRHVVNRTPVAVPTEGGLVTAFDGDRVGVAIEPSERLSRSPMLTSPGRSAWSPQQLPAAVVDARHALSIGPGPTTAVTVAGHGTLVVLRHGRWHRMTDAAHLSPGGPVRLDSVVWADRSVGWVTGHGAPGTPVAYGTRDGGRTWNAVEPDVRPVAALAPCGSGRQWLLPVIDADHRLTVLRSVDQGRSWSPGSAVRTAGGAPVWGCLADSVWLVGDGRLYASADGGRTWVRHGSVPEGLSDVAPTGSGAGVAVSSGAHQTLWAVTGDGAHFAPVDLPGWVGALGRTMSGS